MYTSNWTENIMKQFKSVFGESWRIRLLYEWFLDFLRNHPEWMSQWKSNNQDKSVIKDTEPRATKDMYNAPKVDWGPFKRLPNIRNFKVDLGESNKLMALFGIKSKFEPTLSYEAYDNLGMNKYVNYQIHNLRVLAKENPKEYFRAVNNLLKHSKVFFVMALNHVNPRWHREIPLWMVIKLFKAHNKISRLKSWDVVHHRLYIKKASGKLRPLGVPSLIWRIYIHQVSNFLSLYLEERSFFKKEGDGIILNRESQHGFRTRLGTKTAWQEILTTVTKADWVFEFDLERCFSNIHVKGVSKALRLAKVPEGWISKFHYLNMVPVRNPLDIRRDTTEENELNKYRKFKLPLEERIKRAMKLCQRSKELEIGLKILQPKEYWPKDLQDLSIEEYRGHLKMEATMECLRNYNDFMEPEETNYESPGKEDKSADSQRGLPQGLPSSPLLTIASLQVNFIDKSPWEMIMYADDGIIYGSGKPPSKADIINRLSSSKWGITLNEEKSRFAKLPGDELDLKFLGMRLKGDTLTAETRNGAVLKYDKQNLVDIYDMLDNWNVVYRHDTVHSDERREADVNSFDRVDNNGYYCYKAFCERNNRTSWVRLANSKLWGLIQARLFQDGWEIDFDQCFELTNTESSWVGKRGRYMDSDLNVFNSTSFACHDLLNLLSKVKHKGRGKGA